LNNISHKRLDLKKELESVGNTGAEVEKEVVTVKG
jgi:hypothetical protein